jgi:hypothetical protein
MAAGTRPDPEWIDPLVERCAIEPDFFVRDMLTWALTRHPAELTVPRLLQELSSGVAQGTSQALHSLSKIGDRRAWPSITRDLLVSADDDVARAAWRAAVNLVPDHERSTLAGALATQLGRGDRELQLSLSRALVELDDAAADALTAARADASPAVREHAVATGLLLEDPDAGFEFAVNEAKRMVALEAAPDPHGHDSDGTVTTGSPAE